MRAFASGVSCTVALALLALSAPVVGRQATAGRVSFFDDFSGPDLDRSRWNVMVTGRTVNNEPAYQCP